MLKNLKKAVSFVLILCLIGAGISAVPVSVSAADAGKSAAPEVSGVPADPSPEPSAELSAEPSAEPSSEPSENPAIPDGLHKDADGVWYYYQDGAVDTGFTGLVKEFGTWFYIENGVLNWDYSGLVKDFGTWFYVENGVLDWQFTGLVKQFGTWFYVKNSILDWSYTGLVKDFGTWFYVDKNVLNWQFTGLTEYNGTWYYVERSVLNWNYSGQASHDGISCYVKNGIVTVSDIPESEAYARLMALQESYPNGKYWNHGGVTSSACRHSAGYWYCNTYVGINWYLFPNLPSIQCFGFASLLSDSVFGPDAPVSLHQDFDRLKVGDHIRLTTYSHSMIVLSKTENAITVAECNADFETCVIRWGRTITRQELEQYNRVYISRYLDSESDGTAAIGSAKAVVNVRTGPGTDYPIAASLASGTRFTIINKLNDSYYLVETTAGKRGYVSAAYITIVYEL